MQWNPLISLWLRVTHHCHTLNCASAVHTANPDLLRLFMNKAMCYLGLSDKLILRTRGNWNILDLVLSKADLTTKFKVAKSNQKTYSLRSKSSPDKRSVTNNRYVSEMQAWKNRILLTESVYFLFKKNKIKSEPYKALGEVWGDWEDSPGSGYSCPSPLTAKVFEAHNDGWVHFRPHHKSYPREGLWNN